MKDSYHGMCDDDGISFYLSVIVERWVCVYVYSVLFFFF